MKIAPWKRYSEDEYLETVYEYQCPDCNQVIWIANHPVVEEYNYCPRCGTRRIPNDPAN